MMSRTSFTSNGFCSPFRTIVIVIGVFGLPRILLTASSMVVPRVAFPSMRRMMSPLFMPALSAGVFSIGEMTVRAPSFMPTVIPRPPNSPFVCTCISLNAFSFKNPECASRLFKSPSMALSTISLNCKSST